MTIRRAIEILDPTKPCKLSDAHELDEALRLAIEALQLQAEIYGEG